MVLPIYSFVIKLQSRFTKVENIIAFESHPDFTDNTKVLFDKMYSLSLNDQYQFIWFVDDVEAVQTELTKYEKVKLVPLKGIGLFGKLKTEYLRNRTLASCKFYFFSNRQITRVAPKKNQRFVYLTHGIGLKYWKDRGFSSELFSDICVSSNYAAELIAENFDQVDEKKIITGNPRNSALLEGTQERKNKVSTSLNLSLEQEIFLWMPTYRRHVDGTSNDSGHTDTESDLPIIKNENDWNTINEVLSAQAITLIFKPHPQQDMSKVFIDKLSNVRVINDEFLKKNGLTTYEVLSVTDALLTDYSSVYFDYMLVNKPVAFTIDDFDQYNKNVGFVVDKPLEIMPGEKILNINDLVKFIETYKLDSWKEQRNILCKKIHDTPSLDYSMNILKVLNIVEEL